MFELSSTDKMNPGVENHRLPRNHTWPADVDANYVYGIGNVDVKEFEDKADRVGHDTPCRHKKGVEIDAAVLSELREDQGR